MQIELRLPDLDVPGVAASICTWHAGVGQHVIEGDRLVEIVAGDVMIDLPSPASGTLIARRAEIDQPVKSGQVLAVIEAEL